LNFKSFSANLDFTSAKSLSFLFSQILSICSTERLINWSIVITPDNLSFFKVEEEKSKSSIEEKAGLLPISILLVKLNFSV
jgi:hypothetical protein